MSVVTSEAVSDSESDRTATADENSRVTGAGSLRRLWPQMRPYRAALFGSAVLSGLGMLCDIALPLVTAKIVDGPVAHRDFGAIWPPIGVIVVLALVSTLTSWWRRHIIAAPASRLEVSLRGQLFERLQVLSVGVHDGMESGQLTSRAITDMSTLRRFFAFVAPSLLSLSATLGIGVALLFVLSWQIGLVELLIAVPLVVLALRFEQGYGAASRAAQDQSGHLATTVEESAQGIRVLKAFGRGPWFGRRFRDQARGLRNLELVKVRLAARLWTALNTFSMLGIAAALAIGGYLQTQQAMTVGALVAGITLTTYLQWPTMGLGFLLAETNHARTAAQRFWEVIDTPIEITDPDDPIEPPERLRGELRFDRVRFRFPDTDRDLLHDISLRLRPGETVAVVGATGSGKSALLGLVPRLFDVAGGAVTIDGIDVRSMRLSRLRSQVSVAFEDPVLFSASVRENITLGCPDATEEQIRDALEVACAAQFVDELPWGLRTRIGEQGLSLSGGQRQRLALARAVLDRHNRPGGHIVVLDDPLSALDVSTEEQVQRRLHAALAGATVLLVAHRPSTAAWADRVAVLDEGRIIADGPHELLLETCSRYRELMGGDLNAGTSGRIGERVAAGGRDRTHDLAHER
ncbi:putative ABC transporter, ATP-binding/membrane protein [Nocardia nova SH22a]|uniref:Putative ABC transporter, ATP-binding/membrane protein n=1 Tax=Nocardia nova SH22a TaxID=1415166 RepID=W5TCS0_9NOCA|nr:ABC transporter ATP-binding protein [Nocardia nova]AHH15026.1 putative ABC transporter, ATP-binding/membrane protein [Nocardia nova SH22a]